MKNIHMCNISPEDSLMHTRGVSAYDELCKHYVLGDKCFALDLVL